MTVLGLVAAGGVLELARLAIPRLTGRLAVSAKPVCAVSRLEYNKIFRTAYVFGLVSPTLAAAKMSEFRVWSG